MKQTKLAIHAGLAMLVMATLACSIGVPKTGNIMLELPAEIIGASANRAIVGDSVDTPFVRIYLETAQGNLTLVRLPDGAIIEWNLATQGTTIEILDVPPLTGARLYIAMSTAGGANFRPGRYLQSAAFNVIAGGTATATMTLLSSPFQDITMKTATGGVKAAAVGSDIYASANGVLYKGNAQILDIHAAGGFGITAVNSMGAGKVLTADGKSGAAQLWINTDKGVFALQADNSLAMVVEAADVSESGVVELKYAVYNDQDPDNPTIQSMEVAYYQRKGSFGFSYPGSEGWKWTDLMTDLLAAGGAGAGMSGITDLINPNSSIVADYAIGDGNKFAYFITPIGTLRIAADIVVEIFEEVQNGGGTIDVNTIIKEILGPNTIIIPNQKIQGLAYAGGRLMIGTDFGILTATVSKVDGEPTSQLARINIIINGVSRSVNVSRIRSWQFTTDGPVWTAVLGRAGTVYLFKNDSMVQHYRFFTGTPALAADPTRPGVRVGGDLFWTDAGLVITGINGVVLLSKAEVEKL
jgi:hypothetical protein